MQDLEKIVSEVLEKEERNKISQVEGVVEKIIADNAVCSECYIVAKYGKSSNEHVWYLAFSSTGTLRSRYLGELYKRVERLWFSSIPVDHSGRLTVDDWKGIAAYSFMQSWTYYKPEKYRFSTFIFTCIKRGWINELKKISSRAEKGCEVSTDEFSNLLKDVSFDEGLYDCFVERFRRHLEVSSNLETVSVFDFCLKCGTFNVNEIKRSLTLPIKTIQYCIDVIRSSVMDFVYCEKALLH